MASTIKVQDTINWTLPAVRYSPLNVGTNLEPSVSNANMIKQIIFSPPFVWRFNRAVTSGTTTANIQDVEIAVPDFGFIEKAVVIDVTGVVYELTIETLMSEVGLTSEAGRPTFIALQLDDNAGNLTFRLSPVPDDVYTVKITYQKKPTLVTAANLGNSTATWAPIPDEYVGIVVQPGMLALAFLATDDTRFPVFWTRFLAGLIGVSEGLTEMDKILFLGNMTAFANQLGASQIMLQQGTRSRAT